MPAATTYQPETRHLREAAEHEQRRRHKLHHTNWNWYSGNHRKPLKSSGAYDDNVRVNLAGDAVQQLIAFAFSDFPRLQIDPEADTNVERLLRDGWRRMGEPTSILQRMALNGALDGHVFVRVLMRGGAPELRVLRGDHVTVFWDQDDKDRVLWYEVRWDDYRQDIVRDGARWLIRDFQQRGREWTLDAEHAWPHALGPIVEWQHLPDNVHYYGRHEFGHAHLNDHVNYVASNLMRILRYHAHPRTIGTGFEATSVQDTGVDGFWTIPNENARVTNLEMKTDLQSSMAFLQWLTAHYYKLSQVVTVEGGLDAYKSINNLGLRVAFLPMLQKASVLRRQYGGGLAAISQRLLMLAGLQDYALPIVAEWGHPLPVDRREDVGIIERQMGLELLSRRTAAAQLGLDFDQEQARLAAETEADLDALAATGRE